MKKIDSLRKIAETFISKQVMTPEHSKLILKAQASLKEHVLNGDCTYCGKKVDREDLKGDMKVTVRNFCDSECKTKYARRRWSF